MEAAVQARTARPVATGRPGSGVPCQTMATLAAPQAVQVSRPPVVPSHPSTSAPAPRSCQAA
ncbi:hypothetical protein E1265_25805 [Streptomyces sp. 8K308]|nr:hypothetical protein E1265_25805 [Streptomyces sp. 8K308]